MRVRNLNGATSSDGDGRNWLAHWEKLSGQNAFMCFAEGCINIPSVGGHVQKDSSTDRTWYVIPLCSGCNKKKELDLNIWDMAKLLSANAIDSLEIAAVTPRNFAQWARERFPAGRVFGVGGMDLVPVEPTAARMLH